MRRALARTSLLLAATTVAACASNPRHLHPFDGTREINCTSPTEDALEITYLGTAGMLLRRGGDAIMTAPFFSNPNMLRVGFLPIGPDPERIEAGLADVDVADVKAILVGHAHYDHLMDALWVAEYKAPAAHLYGSDTMVALGCSKLPDARLHSLEPHAGDWWNAGCWEPVIPGRVRVMALRSEHAPHIANSITLFGGQVKPDTCRTPWTAWGWKEGQTLAYLIDFLDGKDADGNDRIALRIHVQDSASTPPYGFPPPAVLAEHPVDVSIPCVASFNQVDGYPEQLMRYLEPHHVVLTHWDNFFRRQVPTPSAVPLLDTRAFAARLTAALPPGVQWHTPNPRQTVRLCLHTGGRQSGPAVFEKVDE
jgi:L-ascorbate metabolism protein UlaG (beta-lactamase superfamily)